MKRFPLFLLFTLLTLSTVPAQADIIDDTIGNIQQAINDAYNPDRGRDYEDSRDDGWQREVSDDRRRQYDAAASLKIAAGSWTIASASLIRSVGNWRMKSGEWKMSMGDEVGYGAGIAPHPNGEREKTSAIFNIEHNRSPRPSGERVRVRGPARTFPLITPPQSPSHQTPPQTLTVVRFPSATHQTGG